MAGWGMITTVVQFVLFVVVAAGHKCSSPCGENNSIFITSTKLLRCTVKHIGHVPFSKNEEQTAPMPQNITAAWYVTDRNWIALTVKWSQRATDVTSGNVKGYYLKFEELRIRIKVGLVMKDIKRYRKNVTSQNVVNFEYPCVGKFENLMLQPGSKITIKLHSLPMFRQNDKSQFKKVKVTVPRCEDDQRLSRINGDYECLSYWKGFVDAAKTAPPYYTNKTMIFVHERYPDHTIYFVLAGAIAVFAIIPILLCLVQRSGEENKGPGTITMITNESIFDMTKAHKLVTKLREQYDLEITTNWENQKLIARDGYQWYQDTINRSTTVVFITETWSKDSSLDDNEMPIEIRQAMQCTRYLQVTNRTEVVILTTTYREHKKTASSRYTIFEENRDFFKLVQKLTGKNVSKDLTLDKLFAMERKSTPVGLSQQMYEATYYESGETNQINSLLRDSP